MIYQLSPDERQVFKRCRRAWDLHASERRGLEPRAATTFDPVAAVTDALAVYYFPGMWSWDRDLVHPLVLAALERRLGEDAGDEPVDLSPLADLLSAYFSWAPELDRFTPLRVETEYDATIPDPGAGDEDLRTPDGVAIHYRGRADLVVSDHANRTWVVTHRVLPPDTWSDPFDLLLDEEAVTACWAWQRCYLETRVAGTIHNEIVLPGPDGHADPPEPPEPLSPAAERIAEQHHQGPFRRTRIRRHAAELEVAARSLAAEVREMTAPTLVAYPSPSPEHCAPCSFRKPCALLSAGSDASAVLAVEYRPRTVDKRPRIGRRTWSMGRGAAPLPPRRADGGNTAQEDGRT